nr:YidB family protein [Peristeroidobacter agariperforans]
MGLLDQISGAVGGMLGQGQAGAQGSGVNSGLLQQVIGMLGTPGAMSNITKGFHGAGLDNVLQSWVGTGQNLPITGDQVKQVLGSGNVADLGARAGLSESDASNQLAGMLPQVIDKLTPDGKLPSQSDLSSVLGKLTH